MTMNALCPELKMPLPCSMCGLWRAGKSLTQSKIMFILPAVHPMQNQKKSDDPKTPSHSRQRTGRCSFPGGIAAAVITLLLITAGCTQQQDTGMADENETTPLVVAVTILPQQQFVERITGGYASVIVLVPPGASPHTYEPTPEQLVAVSEASVYVKVGSGIEFERAWMDKIAGVNPGMAIVDSSAGIRLMNGKGGDEDEREVAGHEHESGEAHGSDPHIWLSLKNARIMVENTYQGIATADPSHAAEYRAHADTYIRELDGLDAGIAGEVAANQVSAFMVYHPSWGYFARDYGLTQIPIETEGKDPTPAGIANLMRQAKEENITVVFASPEYSTRSAEVIAQEIGGSVALVSPLEGDYLGNMRHAASAFIRGGSRR